MVARVYHEWFGTRLLRQYLNWNQRQKKDNDITNSGILNGTFHLASSADRCDLVMGSESPKASVPDAHGWPRLQLGKSLNSISQKKTDNDEMNRLLASVLTALTFPR
jgi:hypothetical protein